MPFKSERQRKFMHANHPEIAERWEREGKREPTKQDRRSQKTKRGRSK